MTDDIRQAKIEAAESIIEARLRAKGLLPEHATELARSGAQVLNEKPALETGEWHTDGLRRNGYVHVYDGPRLVAMTPHDDYAARIIANHAAVPRLVEALNEARSLLRSNDELARVISEPKVLKVIGDALALTTLCRGVDQTGIAKRLEQLEQERERIIEDRGDATYETAQLAFDESAEGQEYLRLKRELEKRQ